MKPIVCTAMALLGLVVAAAPASERRLTPADSIEEAARSLQAGDTLVLAPGVYHQSVTLGELVGTPTAPITIRGEPGAILEPTEKDGVLVLGANRAQYLVIEGLTIRNAPRAGILINATRHLTVRRCALLDNGIWGVQSTLSDAITVEDCELAGSRKQHGVYFSTTDHPVLRGCRIHDNAGCGAHFNGDISEGGDGIITGAVVEDNLIYRNGVTGGSAVNMDSVEHARIRNNLIVNNHSGGITSFTENGIRAGDDHVIQQNTVVFQPAEGRFAIQIMGSVTNVTLERNVLVAGRSAVLELTETSAGGIRSNHNLFYSHAGGNVVLIDNSRMSLVDWQELSGQDVDSSVVAPAFVNPSATNYAVTATLPRGMSSIGWQARPTTR